MVRTRTRDSEERGSSEFELHQRRYGKRFAYLLGLGIGMGVLAAILSLLFGGTTEVAEDVTDATGEVAADVGDAAGDAANSVGEVGSNVLEGTQDAAGDVGDAAGDAANSVGEVGSNVLEGTQDTAGDVGDAVAGVASGVGINQAVDLLQSGKWEVNQAIPLQVNEPVQFDYNSAMLTNAGKQTVSELAQEIKQLDSEQVAVTIIGHTSQTGNPQENLLLSRQRADTVAEELRNLGVEKTISTEGKGYTEPMANIPADDARQQRTEVQLTRVQ